MSKNTLRLRRAALQLLHDVGMVGMPLDLFRQYLGDELAAGPELSDQAAQDLLAALRERGWVRSYTNPITEQVRWILTAQGEGARAALGNN